MRCENCQSEITFFMALRQALPHRFRCTRCGARYRVRAPRMGFITAGIVAVFAALLYQFALGMIQHGTMFIVPFMILTVVVWLAFEVLLYRHITRNGELIRLDTGTTDKPNAPAEEAQGAGEDASGGGREGA